MILPNASTAWQALSTHLEPLGFEVHPLLVGWYNEKVAEKFRLAFPADTLAFVVISRPAMFEQCFLPFLQRSGSPGEASKTDPIDRCMRETLSGAVASALPDVRGAAVLHDFELSARRRPKVLVQTAAHVAGAVRLFRPADVSDASLLPPGDQVFPVCMHPALGGWFAIRAVVVLGGILCPDLPPRATPLEGELGDREIAELLKLYNHHWRDWSFRDVGVKNPEDRYSELQKEYFSTPPGDRWKIVERLRGQASQ